MERVRHIWLISACLLGMAAGCTSHVEDNALEATPPATAALPPSLTEAPAPRTFLRTAGRQIVDEAGRSVRLRGCNIGGWLLLEPWIPGLDHQEGFETEKELWDLLGRRFGEDAKLDLIWTYRRNFFDETDVKQIAAAGMNCLRVPIWWRATSDPNYGGDIGWLDDCVRWCRENGVYVIIDLQGAPGGQAEESANVGEPSNGGALWHSERHKDATVEWWKMIAARYRDEPAVAAYDLINEGTATPQHEDLVDLYDRLYREIRAIDPRHMIIMESVWGFHLLPQPADRGWTNVIYSFHVYARSEEDGAEGGPEWFPGFRRTALDVDVPIYVGEFNSVRHTFGGTDTFLRWKELCEYYGWAWTFWTYKKVEANHDINWGLTGYYDDPPIADINKDSFETIKAHFERLQSSHGRENPMLRAALAAPDRWAEPAPPPVPGATLLTLRDAFVLPGDGGAMKVEWAYNVPSVGYWTRNDTVAWRFRVPSDGIYEIGMRMANDAGGNAAALWIDGALVTRARLPNTHGWRRFQDVSLGRYALRAGRHTIEIGQGDQLKQFINMELAWFAASGSEETPRDESEFRLTPVNLDPLPPKSPIRVEWQSNPPAVGNWASGEKVSWSIPVGKGGSYTVRAIYATPTTGTLLRAACNGKPTQGATLPPTAGWQEYKAADVAVLELSPGPNTITLSWTTPTSGHAGNLRALLLRRGRSD